MSSEVLIFIDDAPAVMSETVAQLAEAWGVSFETSVPGVFVASTQGVNLWVHSEDDAGSYFVVIERLTGTDFSLKRTAKSLFAQLVAGTPWTLEAEGFASNVVRQSVSA